jgi:hypothetical protein
LFVGSLAFGIYSGYKVMDATLGKGASEAVFGIIIGTLLYLATQLIDCHMAHKTIIEYYHFPSKKVNLLEKFKNDRWFLITVYTLLVVTIKNILIGALFQIMLAADYANSYVALTVIMFVTLVVLVVSMIILIRTIN